MIVVRGPYLAVYQLTRGGALPVFGVIEIGKGFIVRHKFGPDGMVVTTEDRLAEWERVEGDFMVNGVWSDVGIVPEHPHGPMTVVRDGELLD